MRGVLRFLLKPDEAVREVYLAGEFSNWEPVPMHRRPDGRFVVTVSVGPGEYRYKFICDGRWVDDPDNGALGVDHPTSLIASVARAI